MTIAVYLNNRHHDPTLGQFISVDPLVIQTGEAYVYGSANPIVYLDPTGLCSMISGDLWCSGSNYGPSGNGHMSVSSVMPEEDPWSAWGIWQTIGDTCSTCEGFDIAGGSGNACLGVSGCAAAAEYILYETAGNPAAASGEQFANAKWIAANYCHYEECGAGNLLAYTNQANLLAAAADVLLLGGGFADDILRVGLRQSLDDQLASTPTLTGRYVRPTGATTSAQRAAVQNLPCVDCGVVTSPMHADHIIPLVREYYENFFIDLQRMRQVGSVQPQCPVCSARQGTQLSQYSRLMARAHGFQ